MEYEIGKLRGDVASTTDYNNFVQTRPILSGPGHGRSKKVLQGLGLDLELRTWTRD